MQLRWYQDGGVNSVFEYFIRDGKKGNPVVAMPTGTGKSLTIAELIRRILYYWPTQRLMMLTHVKELIEQNAEELIKLWPTAPLGIYSAGLKQKDIILPIVFGGVQSVSKNVEAFGHRDLLLIDEAHLLSPKEDTAYQETIKKLKEINPFLKVVGFTATPFRLKQGMLTDGGIFTDICYDVTNYESFNRLIGEGFLSPLIPKKTLVEIDVSKVGVLGGEYNGKQLDEASDDKILFAAVKETVEYGADRKSWLCFASSIDKTERVAAMFQSFGIAAAAIHSKLSDEENRKRYSDFKNGYLRCLVNKDKATTGFNHPPIDLICMLRPTLSPGLWVQMLGRGTRPCSETGKENCLVLDFAGNTRRLGPINDPRIPNRPGRGTGDMPVRICDCGAYNHAAARFCCNCGAEFLFQTKIFETASEHELLRSNAPQIEYFDVQNVFYKEHKKLNGSGVQVSPPTLKVSYICGLRMFNEYICLEHSGMAGKMARDWWRQRHAEEPPQTIYQALQRTQQLKVPRQIRVWVNKQFPEVTGYEY